MDNQEIYSPISCSFYDYLEEAATLKKKATITFLENNREANINDTIKTLFIKDKAEFMRLSSGKEIRLDKLISFNNKKLPKLC